MSLRHTATRRVQDDKLESTRAKTMRPRYTESVAPVVQRRPHLSIESRSRSDFDQSYKSFKIGTISEGIQQVTQNETQMDDGQSCPNLCSQQTNVASCSDSKMSSSVGTLAGKLVHHTEGSGFNATLSEIPPPTTPADKRPSMSWRRTLSGGIFFERSSSSKNASTSSQESVLGMSAMKPLRPPVSPHPLKLSSSSEHHVRVETSFSQLNQTLSPATPSKIPENVPRRPLMDPRDLFPSYVSLMRRFGKGKARDRTMLGFKPRKDPTVQDHRTGWRRENITSALHRVSSLLSDIRLPRSNDKTWSDHSAGSSLFRNIFKDIHADYSTKQPVPVERVRSMEMVSNSESESSSLRRMHIGFQPPNTPNEQATYRVKRSPSAGTEDFLKIDISIRGGTSYLPSEARRIHTPPLPKEGPDGRKRGFFFDYDTAQRLRDHSTGAKSSDNKLNIEGEHYDRCSRVNRPVKCTKMSPVQCSDWYGIQLAELDCLSDEEGDYAKLPAQTHSSTIIADQLKKEREEQMDYTIPEHLPSSPLCPRHPRYWRIIKGTGSQFRGCWMHGVGLWENNIIPGVSDNREVQ